MTDLQTFREETRDWLEANCPQEMRKPGDVAWGGRNAQFSHPDQKIWLERMGKKGWTCPTWPSEYGGGGLSKEENKILQEEIVELKGVNSAIDIINVARPNWLRSGVGTSSNISVYQNGMYIGGLSELNYISVQTIIDMKLLSPSEATTIYGTNNMLGAIEIRTR